MTERPLRIPADCPDCDEPLVFVMVRDWICDNCGMTYYDGYYDE